MASLKGVIFNYSVILHPNKLERSKGLLNWIHRQGLSLVVFSTNGITPDGESIKSAMQIRGLPVPDLVMTKADVGVPKGSPIWIDKTAERMEVETNQFLYVGDDRYDWRTALHTATFYLHALWSKPSDASVKALTAKDPYDIYRALTHFLLPPPRWEYTLDVPDLNFRMRSLLNANARFPSSDPSSFSLQDVFTRNRDIRVGDLSAQDVLMRHALGSLYLEGLIPRRSWFAIYPSSSPGKDHPVLVPFLRTAKYIFGASFKEDLLIRAVAAKDTSIERANKRLVSESEQTNTVHINPEYHSNLAGQNIILFDDFTTDGISLEWARNLFVIAGVGSITLLTIGKYGLIEPVGHQVYQPNPDATIFPFSRYTSDTIPIVPREKIALIRNKEIPNVLKKSFDLYKDGKPLPKSNS